MVPDITELNFPQKDGKQYVTLSKATANVADMGEKTVTADVKIDGDIVPDFSYDWAVEFQGEKYIMPLRVPQGSIGNDSLDTTVNLTFQHWAIYQLKRWPFVKIQQLAAGTYLPDEEVADVSLNLKDFCALFGQVLEYYYGGAITIDLNPAWQYSSEATVINISHTKIWNVLIETLHDKYGVRWEIKPAADNDNTVKGGERYVIRVGYDTTEVSHIFEYGFDGGLLKLERQPQSEEIRNMLKGRGGDTNIPLRYFKDKDPNNPDFTADPDWVEELATAYLPNLMGATFRSYVQGWKAAHIGAKNKDGKLLYKNYMPVGEANAYSPWAYRKGYTDTKFAPVEFVADDITVDPETADPHVEILPGYSPYVKKGSSLDKYGPLPDTLDNNDDIYPTLQGTGMDIAVDVEQIESDDVAESTDSDAQTRTLPREVSAYVYAPKTTRKEVVIESRQFEVAEGKTANLDEGVKNITLAKNGERYVYRHEGSWKLHVETFQIPVDNDENKVVIEDASLVVVNAVSGETVEASGISAGNYYFKLSLTVYNTSDEDLNVQVECPSPKLTEATIDDKRWRNTFDIWVKNIWASAKGATESDVAYSERVWKPVLGDREGNTAKVVFTSGELALNEDYEFTIVGYPVYDTSKSWEEKNEQGGVIETHTSHWCITLAKSDAEMEATGLYIPSTKRQGKAGDRFVFIGTEILHVPYVTDAEKRLDDWKKDQLGEKKEIKPTFVVTTDRVRLNNEGKPDALINQLRTGNSIRLADKRFIQAIGDRAYETLYLQSITYTYREPTSEDTALNPDVEIVLGNEYTTSANPVSMMQGEISALQRQVGSISNIEQIVRAVGDKLYLRKDGIADRSLSPTQFFSLLTSGDFRAGLLGGTGWGMYKDENGNWVFETDRLAVRQDMNVNRVVINQAEGRGGMDVDTAAYMTVTRVDDTPDGYVCYFDQKNGSVANLFHVGDVAFCNQWTAENSDLKSYKRRVTAIATDNITLAKTTVEGGTAHTDWLDSGVNGTGIPAEGDVIIQYGSYTDHTRQYVKVRDVVGGGYERYIEALNSVNSAGIEHYFVGKQAGRHRWFVGNRDLIPYSGDGKGAYIEYINRKLNLNNVTLSLGTTIGDKLIDEYFADKAKAETDRYKYLAEALGQDTEITGGLIMSTLVSLGYKDGAGLRHTLAGMNGAYLPSLGGRTIASWWGGEMLDWFKADGTLKTADELIAESGKANPVPAASLVRMDGSAYFSKGKVQFKADGTAQFGLGEASATINGDGQLILGNGIKINIGGGAQGLTDTLSNLSTIVNGLNNVLYPVDASGNKLNWNAPAANIHAIKAVKGFFSTDFISALGMRQGESGGTGGGTAYDRLDSWSDYTADKAGYVLSAYLGADLNSRVGANASSINSILSRLVTLEGGGTASVEVNGSGNAITDISKAGTAIVATKGATFLTEHQTLDHIDNLGTVSPVSGDVAIQSGLRLYSVFENGYPEYYGNLLRIGGYGGGELLCGWSFDNSVGNILYRSKTGWSPSSWSDWTTILTSANFDRVFSDRTVRELFTEFPGHDCATYDAHTRIDFTYGNNAPFTGGFIDVSAHGYGFYLGTWSYADGALYYRRHGSSAADGGIGEWQQLARITDNVASATKLQTTRTLWGQSFDGTGSVSGDLTGVGRIVSSFYGLFGGADSSGLRLTGDGSTDWWVQTYSGKMFLGVDGTNMQITSSGFVGIGLDPTEHPKNMLHVNGTARVTALRIGDATITWDAANGGLKIDKGLYSESYLSALGITRHDGGVVSVKADKATIKTATITTANIGTLSAASATLNEINATTVGADTINASDIDIAEAIRLNGATITWDAANNALKINGKTILTA